MSRSRSGQRSSRWTRGAVVRRCGALLSGRAGSQRACCLPSEAGSDGRIERGLGALRKLSENGLDSAHTLGPSSVASKGLPNPVLSRLVAKLLSNVSTQAPLSGNTLAMTRQCDFGCCRGPQTCRRTRDRSTSASRFRPRHPASKTSRPSWPPRSPPHRAALLPPAAQAARQRAVAARLETPGSHDLT